MADIPEGQVRKVIVSQTRLWQIIAILALILLGFFILSTKIQLTYAHVAALITIGITWIILEVHRSTEQKVEPIDIMLRHIRSKWFQITGQWLDITKLELEQIAPREFLVYFTTQIVTFQYSFNSGIIGHWKETLNKVKKDIEASKLAYETVKQGSEAERTREKIRKISGMDIKEPELPTGVA